MAKYDVKFSCGHEETVELFGKSADRERKIAYFEKHGVCSECYKTQQAAAAAEKTAAWELPELTGTPKQIAWAEKLRADRFEEMDNAAKKVGKASAAEAAAADARVARFTNWLKGQTEAKFWIDNRDRTKKELALMWMEIEKGAK